MDITDITPDQVVFWKSGFVAVSATLVYTWAVMALLVVFSWLVTRKLSTGRTLGHGQNLLEILFSGIEDQIRDVSQEAPDRYIPLIGTLFIFIIVSNILSVVPGFTAPTASLSTTAALAICVFFAVPVYGIADRGVKGYLALYVTPTPLMLPFNIMGELSRTLALAVRLFGNLMSTGKVVMILLAVIPFVFPVLLDLLGLLTGVIQAYIFAVLAMVYIASATRARRQTEEKEQDQTKGTSE